MLGRKLYILGILSIFMAKDEITTIKLKKITVEKLKKLGEMGESYEDVILRLIKFYKNKYGVEKSAKQKKQRRNSERAS